MASFLLIRHAKSPWSPDESRSLTPSGLRAAGELVERLNAVDVEAIYCSPYRRAQQTIEPLASRRGLMITTVPELRERPFVAIGDVPSAQAARLAWTDLDSTWPGGETARDAQKRILRFVEQLLAADASGVIALSTHGNLLALLLNAFDSSIGYDFWNALRLPDLFMLRVRGPNDAVFSRL